MKDFMIYTLAIILAVYLFSSKSTLYVGFMSREQTNVLKGFSVLTVLWAHSGMDYGIRGIQWVAGIGVSLFLVFSGYGLLESYKKNGLKNFWKKRLVGVLVPFYLIYIVGTILVTKQIQVNELIGIILLQKVNWYIQYIIICYIIFWISLVVTEYFKLNIRQRFQVMALFFILWFIVDTYFFAMKADPFLRARQMLSFPLGILISDNKEYGATFFEKKEYNKYFILLGVIGIIFLAITQTSYMKNSSYLLLNICSLFTILPLTIIILWLSERVKFLFNSKFLMYIGYISYELYLVQVFSRTVIIKHSIWTLFVFLGITIIIASIVNYAFKRYISKMIMKVLMKS